MDHALEKDPYVVTLLFDKKLIDLGEWPEDIYPDIEEWNETTDYETQRNKAASLISTLVLRILGNDCSSRGKIRARRLGKSLANFEQIVISTRELENKFYRDHLNHAIRVSLLARAIGLKSPFKMPSRDLDKIVLASLFHDVAYPLSTISQAIQFSVRAIKDCYSIASRGSLTHKVRLNLRSDAYSLFSPQIIPECESRLKELDHGVLSSLEFISYLQNRENIVKAYEEVIKAIASHSSSDNRQIDSLQEKISSILILADEFQDWGRPIGHSRILSFIPKIDEFRLADFTLQGEYDTRSITGFSVLRQICTKSPNLKRVRLHRNFDLKLKFPFSKLAWMDREIIEQHLQTLFCSACELERSLFHPLKFKKLYEDGSVFENEYYGKPIPKEIKLRVFELLESGQLPVASPFRDFQLAYDSSINDVLVTLNNVGDIESLQFRSLSGFIRLELVTKSGRVFSGELLPIAHPVVLELAMILMAEMRFFNICVQKLARFQTAEYPVDMAFEGFPRSVDIKMMKKNDITTELANCVKQLIALRDCIFHDGFFFFDQADSQLTH